MASVILFFFLIACYCLIREANCNEDKKKKAFLRLVGIVFILESGLRHLGVGPDTYQYYTIFEEVKDRSFDDLVASCLGTGNYIKDPFFWLFQKCFQLLFPKYHLFLFFVAFLFFFSFNRLLYKNKLSLNDMLMAYLFYLGMYHAFFSYTGIRQTIATSFIILAFISLQEKSFCKYFLFLIIASLFHVSAIIFVLSFILVKMKNPYLLVPFVIIYFCFFITFKDEIVLFFLYSTQLDERFEQFTNQEQGAGSLIVSLLYILLFIILLMKYRNIIKSEILFNCFKLYCLVVSLIPLMWISNSSFRIAYYFSFSMYILVPFIVSQLSFKMKYHIVSLLFLVLTLFHSKKEVEYLFYWQNMALPEYGISRLQEPFL